LSPANFKLEPKQPNIENDLISRRIDRQDLCLVNVEHPSRSIDKASSTEGRQLKRLRKRGA
jgi:hypothetical protein